MSDQSDYEEEKVERRRFAGRQRSLVRTHIKATQNQNFSVIESLKDNFLENLQIDQKVNDYIGIELGRYPIFF